MMGEANGLACQPALGGNVQIPAFGAGSTNLLPFSHFGEIELVLARCNNTGGLLGGLVGPAVLPDLVEEDLHEWEELAPGKANPALVRRLKDPVMFTGDMLQFEKWSRALVHTCKTCKLSNKEAWPTY